MRFHGFAALTLSFCTLTLAGCFNVAKEAKINIGFKNVSSQLKTLSGESTQATGDQHFEEGYCYFINLNKDSGASCSSGASPQVGELFGPVSRGEEISVLTEPGSVRLDLLAFEAANCADKVQVEEHGQGYFKAFMGGETYDPVLLVGTSAVEAVEGEQTVEMSLLSSANGDMGVSLACDDSKKPQVTNVSMSGVDRLTITGSQLAETSRVSLEGVEADFEIVSATESEVVARILESASMLIGQTANLLVSNAWGSTPVELNVSLGTDSVDSSHIVDGSIRPEDLDFDLDWPFPVPKSFSFLSTSVGSQPVLSGTGALVVDGNDGNFMEIDVDYSVANTGSPGGTCDPANPTRIIFQVGDGTINYQGSFKFKIESSVSDVYFQVKGALSAADATSGTWQTNGEFWVSILPAAWRSATFTGSHFYFEMPCPYSPSFVGTYKIFEIKDLIAKPAL